MRFEFSRPLLAVGIAVFAACAPATRTATLTPAEFTELEARRAQTPNDPAINLRLAKAYHGAGRFADARRALATTLAAQPQNREAQAWLGLTYEGLEQFDSARAVYTRLGAERPRGEVRRMIDGRLQVIARAENRAAARQALAREAEITQQPPEPNTVAVMPFRYTGRDSTLRPLERGLAALVITDLGRVSRLRVVERERLQALVDEMKLTQAGAVDPATGARSGRLLRAGQVVQGQFQEVPTASFRIDASVVRATDAQVAATGTDNDRFNALFDMEKRVVFQLLDRLGIVLTPAERTAISERPTRDIQAFLLYSKGLEARDRGDFQAANQAFNAAVQRDPGFNVAAQQAAATEAASEASTAPPTEIAVTIGGPAAPEPAAAPSGGSSGGGQLTGGINAAVPTGAATLGTVSGGVAVINSPPSNPNPACEAASSCGPPNVAIIANLVIIIRRP